jgi:hypothetical protein
MVVDDDARVILAWMKDTGRVQPWRALDRNGKPRVYRKKVCEFSRNKMRLVVNIPCDRIDPALRLLMEREEAMPVGRIMPIESNQAVELWVVHA